MLPAGNCKDIKMLLMEVGRASSHEICLIESGIISSVLPGLQVTDLWCARSHGIGEISDKMAEIDSLKKKTRQFLYAVSLMLAPRRRVSQSVAICICIYSYLIKIYVHVHVYVMLSPDLRASPVGDARLS